MSGASPVLTQQHTSTHASTFPFHWLPGGEAKFIVYFILILLVWHGWIALTTEDRKRKEDERKRKQGTESGD